MFGRKKNPPKRLTLTLSDESGTVLFSGLLTDLVIPDEVVIALSTEFFNDPTPCEIHRSAVLSRAFLSIEDALSSSAEPRAIASLDEVVRRLFSAYPAATRAALLF